MSAQTLDPLIAQCDRSTAHNICIYEEEIFLMISLKIQDILE